MEFAVFVLPSLIAGVLFLVFTYLYEQSRAAYFRAWQLGWACYCASYLLITYNEAGHGSPLTYWCAGVLFAMVPLFIFASTHMLGPGEFPVRARDLGLLLLFMAWAARDVYASGGRMKTVFITIAGYRVPAGIYVGMIALLAVCIARFWRHGRRLHSLPFQLLAVAIGFWAALLAGALYYGSFETMLEKGRLLGPIPEVMIGISMVMVLYDSERRSIQETLLAVSTLEVDPGRIHEAAELEAAVERILARVVAAMGAARGVIWIADAWRRMLPTAALEFSPAFVAGLSREKIGAYLLELLRISDKLVFQSLDSLRRADFKEAEAGQLESLLRQEGATGFTAIALRTREHALGFVLVANPHSSARFGASQLRLLGAAARQLSLTLENYLLMQDAARRTEEFELLAQIGQIVSSRLDSDEVLRTVHRELSRLFDARSFYIAFMEDEEVRFELEYDDGALVPKRARQATRGVTEHVIRTGEALLVRSEMEKLRAHINAVAVGPPAKCFCGVPIFMYGRAVGVMAALSYTREFVYEQRDLDVMKTAAGQVSVAMENARLFAEEQRRSRYLEFLNNVSKTAISSQEPEAMMAEIVREIQKNFRFDHIGIGILDYASKDIEIKAEAGTAERTLGRRIPLGTGILGRVARTAEMTLVQNAGADRLAGILPESKSVLSIPISYSESLLGVLNVESHRENAFAPQEVLILRTLADLLATALHNAFVFQKMQQQSITDGLTGIKTRRYFNEALLSEWKRASRSRRPFSVVLIDLDKFKNVNDSMGHLEGDLVLARLGRVLEQKSRQSNVVARYGGDEFVILMPETGVEQAQILSERLRLWISTDAMLNERQITGSFGVATFPIHGATAEDILRVADMGMYNSKRSGGNQVSTPEDFGHAESMLPFVQSSSVLQRKELGPEALDDLIAELALLTRARGEEAASDLVLDALHRLNHTAETREVSSAGHSESVAEFAEIIGRELKLAADEMLDLALAARLHDVGKILLPAALLNKEEMLNEDELELMQMHPALGATLLAVAPGCTRAAGFIRHHHERMDGAGYPDKLEGQQIPLGARILGLAEAYAQMTSDRPYAARRSMAHALAEIERMSGSQFDAGVARAFLSYMKRTHPVSSGA